MQIGADTHPPPRRPENYIVLLMQSYAGRHAVEAGSAAVKGRMEEGGAAFLYSCSGVGHDEISKLNALNEQLGTKLTIQVPSLQSAAGDTQTYPHTVVCLLSCAAQLIATHFSHHLLIVRLIFNVHSVQGAKVEGEIGRIPWGEHWVMADQDPPLRQTFSSSFGFLQQSVCPTSP